VNQQVNDNIHRSTSIHNTMLNSIELAQIYDLFHFKSFSDTEIENISNDILLATSSTIITNNYHNQTEDEKVSFPPTDGTEDSTINNGIVTPEKVSLVLQQRIRQHLRTCKATTTANSNKNTNPGEEGEAEQRWDARIRTYSDTMANRLMYHLIHQQKGHTSNIDRRDSSPLLPLHMEKLDFMQGLRNNTTNIDYKRVLPISLSMILVGTSVGIIVPLMPFIAENLSLSPGDYGMVVSAFALSKFLGNLPSAILVDRHGRKPYMVYSLSLISMGVGGIGVASTVQDLIACRLIAGFGVAALSTAATLTISDISTPRNRASTMAPMHSGFAAGMALGPAVGGFLGDSLGVSNTFFVVGASYLGVAVLNSFLLTETKVPWSGGNTRQWLIDAIGKEENITSDHDDNDSKNRLNNKFTTTTATSTNTAVHKNLQPTAYAAILDAVGQWAPLLSLPKVRRTVIVNGCYWVALSGAQMTLLPLMLTNPAGLALSATALGKIYMGMSAVQVFGNPSVARVVDQVGKIPSIIGGCTAISASMFALPFCSDTYQLAIALGCWSFGSTALSTAPTAYMVDQVPQDKRAQALVLLRAAGDVGFLFGATLAGAAANWTGSMDLAMQGCSAFLLTKAFPPSINDESKVFTHVSLFHPFFNLKKS
jgi:predicted MFS family arabinose efflux permease